MRGDVVVPLERPHSRYTMRVTIRFCATCDYEPHAVDLAAAVRRRFPDAEIELMPAREPEFEVKRDDESLFDNLKTGRLPRTAEVLEALERPAPDAEG